MCDSFSSFIFSSNTLAGSSLESWETSSPLNAFANIDCVSLSTKAFALINLSSISSAFLKSASTRFTISFCSSNGGISIFSLNSFFLSSVGTTVLELKDLKSYCKNSSKYI